MELSLGAFHETSSYKSNLEGISHFSVQVYLMWSGPVKHDVKGAHNCHIVSNSIFIYY